MPNGTAWTPMTLLRQIMASMPCALFAVAIQLSAQAGIPEGLREKAQSGDAAAQFALAEHLFQPKDSALLGTSETALADAMFKERAAAVAEALQWYRRSAEAGNPEAHAKLALIFRRGLRVEKNPEAGLRWQISAARLGHVPSMLILEQDYGLGVGVERNLEDSAKWAKMASDKGSVQGRFIMAVKYLEGSGVPKNVPEGLKLCRQAADEFHNGAIIRLGILHLDGEHVPQNLVEAYRLLLIGRNLSPLAALEPRFFMQRCEQLMTPAQKAEAERLAARDTEVIRQKLKDGHKARK
jgi:TPR repeat protein